MINFDANELSNNDQQVDNNNTTKVKLENNYASTFVSPESMTEGDFNTVNNKLQPQVLKREESLIVILCQKTNLQISHLLQL